MPKAIDSSLLLELPRDGSLVDVLVDGLQAEEWPGLLKTVRRIADGVALEVDGTPAAIPDDPVSLVETSKKTNVIFRIKVADLDLTWNPIEVSSVELVLDPRQVTESNARRLFEFIRDLSLALSKIVKLTYESTPSVEYGRLSPLS